MWTFLKKETAAGVQGKGRDRKQDSVYQRFPRAGKISSREQKTQGNAKTEIDEKIVKINRICACIRTIYILIIIKKSDEINCPISFNWIYMT